MYVYLKLIKKYRAECKSYSSELEFALSSVSVIRFHIKFMTDLVHTMYDFWSRQYAYRRIFGVRCISLFISRLFCSFNIQDSECLEAATKK